MEEVIRPSSDLRNHYSEISAICKKSHRSVIITVHGKGDTVILDLQEFRRMQAELDLLRSLADSEADISANHVAPMNETFRDIRSGFMNRKDDQHS